MVKCGFRRTPRLARAPIQALVLCYNAVVSLALSLGNA
jgi:hypothetical protein